MLSSPLCLLILVDLNETILQRLEAPSQVCPHKNGLTSMKKTVTLVEIAPNVIMKVGTQQTNPVKRLGTRPISPLRPGRMGRT